MEQRTNKNNYQSSGETSHFLVFSLNQESFALPVENTIRVLQAIEIKQLPSAPEIIAGVIHVNNQIIPVIDLRKRFLLPEREIAASDHLVIADTGKRIVALWVDSVNNIQAIAPQNLFSAKKSLPFAKYIRGIAKTEDGLVIIYDLEQFLSLDEENQLDEVIAKTDK